MKLVLPGDASWHCNVFPAGKRCVTSLAGDLVLVRHSGVVAKGIRFFERLRKPRAATRAEWRAACSVNHAAIVVSGGADAVISQEAAAGDILSPLSSLDSATYAVISYTTHSDAQRDAAVEFAEDALHSGYGWISIFADAFNALSGLELSLGVGDRMVCSTQATRALERADLVPDRSPYAVTPAHMAWWFEVPRLG